MSLVLGKYLIRALSPTRFLASAKLGLPKDLDLNSKTYQKEILLNRSQNYVVLGGWQTRLKRFGFSWFLKAMKTSRKFLGNSNMKGEGWVSKTAHLNASPLR